MRAGRHVGPRTHSQLAKQEAYLQTRKPKTKAYSRELGAMLILFYLCIRENAVRQLIVSQAVYLNSLGILAWIGVGI
ncbi:hypothetical protein AC630_08210 [Bradyrhizobium sp. AS23.2]|nr:hypothetical protein AC630_08210 [Bradyrhizobium sp. AS23.2]